MNTENNNTAAEITNVNNTTESVNTTVDTKDVKATKSSPVKKNKKHINNNVALSNVQRADKTPKHIKDIVYQIRNNVEIRRFTALGIIKYLKSTNQIRTDKAFIVFLWDKFTVKYNNLSRDYLYSEPFFLNAFIASFSSFAAYAQIIVNNFCKEESSIDLSAAVDKEIIDELVSSNIEHQNQVIDNV